MNHDHNAARIIRTIQTQPASELSRSLRAWDFHDVAEALRSSSSAQLLFKKIPADLQSEVIFLLTDETQRTIVRSMSQVEVDAMAHYLDPSDITRLKSIVSSREVAETELKRKREQREDAEAFLTVSSETAEELMKDSYILAKDNFTVADIAIKVDQYLKTHNDIPVIIATDTKGKVKGRIYFAPLITAEKNQHMKDLISPVTIVSSHMDQEDVANLIDESKRDDLVVAVDEDNRPIGVIHATDLLRVMREEATEDLYGFAGVDIEEKAVEPISSAVRYRYRWLIINLLTSFAAAWVITLFEDTMTRLVVLAAYMPIVAGMGGNAGTQTLAVVVRGIATGEIESGEGRKVAFKEFVAGIINGLIVGAIIAVVAYVWHGDMTLGLVLAFAMIVNMVVAGIFGTFIPLILEKMRIDPAVSSSVFLTTITDVVGFFVFLGLASMVL